MTGDRLDPRLIQLVPQLASLVPPGIVIDKAHYSPFKEPTFFRVLGRLNPHFSQTRVMCWWLDCGGRDA